MVRFLRCITHKNAKKAFYPRKTGFWELCATCWHFTEILHDLWIYNCDFTSHFKKRLWFLYNFNKIM